MNQAILHVNDLHASFDRAQPVLRGVELELNAGEVLVVVGASGCGKTTLLRSIAGIERPTQGRIELAGHILFDSKTFVEPELRSVGMVFQGLALFPHLTVRENISFGLRRMSRAERSQRVDDEMSSVGLEGLGDRHPHQLSGGQQQRVAIARSLVTRPTLLLMDEPFSDMDAHTRARVREEVLRILRAHHMPAIIVTHDREDAFHVADRIAEMADGRIQRSAPASEFRASWRAHSIEPTPG